MGEVECNLLERKYTDKRLFSLREYCIPVIAILSIKLIDAQNNL